MRQVPLFYPFVAKEARKAVFDTLGTKWIGQGPKVDAFEKDFQEKFVTHQALAVGAGTDALHLAYVLAGLKKGDEVIAPVFTCTATNIPLLYEGITIKFADIDSKTLNVSIEHIKSLITEKTKAIVVVDYGGLPCDMVALASLAKKHNLILIEDAAHSLSGKVGNVSVGALADYTIFSFQAIKLLTTGDGGMLTIKDDKKYQEGKRRRWFGIDREKKLGGIWENDITEIGYKYQMNDIAASMGLATLPLIEGLANQRKELFLHYKKRLQKIPGITILNDEEVGKTHAHWLLTVAVEKREAFEKLLVTNGIGSNQTHYRNDRYTIFGKRRKDLPNMDAMENKYTLLPLHNHMTLTDVNYVCDVIQKGW